MMTAGPICPIWLRWGLAGVPALCLVTATVCKAKSQKLAPLKLARGTANIASWAMENFWDDLALIVEGFRRAWEGGTPAPHL